MWLASTRTRKEAMMGAVQPIIGGREGGRILHMDVFSTELSSISSERPNKQNKNEDKRGAGAHTHLYTGRFVHAAHSQATSRGDSPVLLGLGTRTSAMAVRIVLLTLRLLTRSMILSVSSLMGLLSSCWSSVDYKGGATNVTKDMSRRRRPAEEDTYDANVDFVAG